MTSSATLPTTSLIITTYNRPDYLRLALNTAIKQSVPPCEIIVADDGSKEETFEATRELRKQTQIPIIHVWQEDKGFRLNSSRNNALAVATGEYVALLDGDCFLGPRYLEDHARAAKRGRFVVAGRVHLHSKRRDYVLRTGDTRISILSSGVSKRLNAIRSRFISRFTSETGKLDEKITLRERHGVAGANMAFWRSDAIKVNGFDERFEGYGGDDVEFANRLVRAGVLRFKLRNLAVARHFAHGERVFDPERLYQKFEEATATNDFRIPDEYGLAGAIQRGSDRIER